MVKLTLPFVMLGLGLATAASAAAVTKDIRDPTPELGYHNPYKRMGTIGDDDLDAQLANVQNVGQLRAVIYDWVSENLLPVNGKIWGICKENSVNCNPDELVCKLDTTDCCPIQQGPKRENVIVWISGIYLTLLTHGKCQHNILNEKWCSTLNLCNKYYVQDDEKCMNLDLHRGSKDIKTIIKHLKSSKGDAYAVEFDVPEESYTLA
ncbi:hypothetical protein NDA13_004046 [Ustilago tritici]|nr:hypothetical protein NDA13_004046 [Ustilago tritici]